MPRLRRWYQDVRLVEITGLNVRFGETTVLRDVDFSVEKGEILLDVCTRGIVEALRAEFG